MARHDTGGLVSKQRQIPPQRRLEYLLNETYVKIDELKELLRKEAALTGIHGTDLGVGRMFSRQDYLVTLCAEACNAAAVAAANNHAHQHQPLPLPSSTNVEKQTMIGRPTKGDKDEAKPEGWYGSLDRSLAKKKKHQFFDKKRRHTKTIGSMAGLDVIKKSVELKPDEQYEIGLPAAPKVTSSRSSIFPMTQHQYYTALMESKLTKKPAYPLEVRQQPQPQHHHQPHHHSHSHPVIQNQTQYPLRPMASQWGGGGSGGGSYLDENKNMKKHFEQHNIPPPPLPPAAPVMPKQNLVPLPCRSLGSEIAFKHSSKSSSSSSKKWYETNLDESPHPVNVTTQNPSPSPSMMSSNRGSSRGSIASGVDTIDGAISRMTVSSPANESAEFTSKSSESSESWSGTGNEVTKPFEMSDYYKYSTKFRSRTSPSEDSNSDNRNMNGYAAGSSTSIIHSRTPSSLSQRQPSFDGSSTTITNNGLRDTNGNPAVGPKLPPKQRRNQNKSISSTIIFEGDTIANGDTNKDIWITNEPTFV